MCKRTGKIFVAVWYGKLDSIFLRALILIIFNFLLEKFEILIIFIFLFFIIFIFPFSLAITGRRGSSSPNSSEPSFTNLVRLASFELARLVDEARARLWPVVDRSRDLQPAEEEGKIKEKK